MSQLSEKLEDSGIDIAKAQSFARQAIAAYPDENDIDVLLGYTKEIQEASSQN